MSEDADLIQFDEVLKVLSVSPERLEDLVIAGELVAFRRGRDITFRKQDLADYLVRHGGPEAEGKGSKLEMENRRAKAVAAKIASLRRSQGDDASALIEKLGAAGGGQEELISVKQKVQGRKAGAAPAKEILVELQKELSAARRRADKVEKEKGKLVGQLQLLDALKEEVKQVAVLAQENEELRKTFSGREGDVAAAERMAQLQRERDRLKEQLKGAEDALSAVQGHASDVSSLRAEKRELERKLEQAREEARASLFVAPDEQVQRAVARMDELGAERQKLLDEMDDLRKQAGRLEARLATVESERDGAVQKLKKSEGSLKATSTKDEEVQRLKTELEETKKELESAKEEETSELRSENESLKSQLAELREKFQGSAKAEGLVEELRSQAEKLRSERDDLREELRSAQVTLGHMRADSAQAKQRGKDMDQAHKEIKELRKEYDQVSARALAAEAARDGAQKEIETLQARVSDAEAAAGEASSAREEANSLRAELEEEKARAQEIEEETARAQQERAAQVSSANEEMEKLKAALEEAKAAQAAAPSADELDSLRGELDQGRARSSELERDLAELKEELAAAPRSEELESARSELEEARARSSELERELGEAKDQLAAAPRPEEIESARSELEEARARIEAAGGPSELATVRTELEEAQTRSSQLEGDLEEAKERLQGAARAKRVKKLESELEIVRSRAQELEGKLAEAASASEDVDELRRQLEGVSTELESVRAENEKAVAEAEALKASAGEGGEFRARLEELSAQLSEAKGDSEANRLEVSRKEGALAALQAQLERARGSEEEARDLMSQLAEVRENLARVQAEVDPLRRERDDLAASLREGKKARAAHRAAVPAAAAPGPPVRRPTMTMFGGAPLPATAPKHVGRFTLLGLIGAGRKGAVCSASSPYAAGVAAVRILPEDLVGNAQFMDHFLPRIRRVAELENKSIVDVLDTGEFPRGYFVATELVDGGSLRERLEATNRINPDETLAIIMQLTKALEVARRAGLVHRDIRPENILFTRDGTPKLSDLGLSLGTTEDGCSVGRGRARYYAAPEQVRGEEADCRADVFSLGAVAYEMLTGQAVYQAATADGAAALYDSAAVEWPDCPQGLATAIARMLCKSPGDRYPTPKSLATDLILLSDGGEPKAEAPIEGQSFVKPPA